MQGVEIEDEGDLLKYMTKSEIKEQHSRLLIMTQRLFSSFNQHDIGMRELWSAFQFYFQPW